MRFINTLDKVRLYLMAKPIQTPEEEKLLEQVRLDLEYFPRGSLHRDDLVEFGYDSQLIPCCDMATLARKIGEDSWEQLSREQIPVIADATSSVRSVCPLCGEAGAFDQDTMFWQCQTRWCRLSWSYMKYACVGYTALTAFFLENKIGYRISDKKETPMYMPVNVHRNYFPAGAEKDRLFQVMLANDPSLVIELAGRGYEVEKIKDERARDEFGVNAWWVSCYRDEE